MPRSSSLGGAFLFVCLATRSFSAGARVLVRRVLGPVCVALLSSCSLVPLGLDDSSKQTHVEMQRIADVVEDHNAAAFKELFPTAARERPPTGSRVGVLPVGRTHRPNDLEIGRNL
jgi:hypothetical protein